MEIVMVFLNMFIFSFLYAIVKKYEIDSEYQHEFETILIYESNESNNKDENKNEMENGIENEDKNEDKNENEIENENENEIELEENHPDLVVERTLGDRINHLDQIIKDRLKKMEKLKNIEKIVSILEQLDDEDKLVERVSIVEQKVEKLFISDHTFGVDNYNEFVKCMYEDVKKMTFCKKHENIMKKLDKMWLNMSDIDKMIYTS